MTNQEILDQVKKSGFNTIKGNPTDIEDFQKALQNIFKLYLETDYVEINFGITDQMVLWLHTIYGDIYYEEWAALYSSDSMVKATEAYYEDYSSLYDDEPERAIDGMFISFGWWSDKHDYFYCCDKTSPLYGKIVDLYDAHPWPMKKIWTWTVYDSVLDILKEYESDDE